MKPYTARAAVLIALIIGGAIVLSVALYGERTAETACAATGGDVSHTWNGRLICEHKAK